ncbi:hypothetical protein [Mesorhizobium sp. 43Arga]
MKIAVIGASHYARASTVKKLQRDGHEVEAASKRAGVDTLITDYRDAGYAGQYLRRRLLHLVSLVHEFWRQGQWWCSKVSIRILDSDANCPRREAIAFSRSAPVGNSSLNDTEQCGRFDDSAPRKSQ